MILTAGRCASRYQRAQMSHDAVDLENLLVSAEEAHAELEIVLRSPTFDRSERLHKFLRYICELTLKGDAARINEYLIGSEVFKRAPIIIPTRIRLFGGRATRFEEATRVLRRRGELETDQDGTARRPLRSCFPARGNSRSAACCGTRYRSHPPAPDVTVEEVPQKRRDRS